MADEVRLGCLRARNASRPSPLARSLSPPPSRPPQGARVALRSDSYTLHILLPTKVDPLVSLMKVEKVPDSTYDMIGGLDQQIKEIKEVGERLAAGRGLGPTVERASRQARHARRRRAERPRAAASLLFACRRAKARIQPGLKPLPPPPRRARQVIELPLKHPELFESLGIAQPKGVLLYGPPGTGKTLLARAVAHHTDCTFIRVSGSELVQKYIGEGSRMVRELFVMAR
jgi:hypothetical protein